MKTIVLAAMMFVVAGAATAGERPVLRDGEAPRATDLLRARKLAEQAEKRLKLPAQRSAGWKHGGSGWNDDSRVRGESEHVTINVGSPKRSSRRSEP